MKGSINRKRSICRKESVNSAGADQEPWSRQPHWILFIFTSIVILNLVNNNVCTGGQKKKKEGKKKKIVVLLV